MKIDTKKVAMVLMDRTISAYQLEKETGVSQSAISRYRNGKRPLENLTLGSIMKIQKWIDDNDFTFEDKD